ncbi:universal stress protein UspE [Succinivibrio sp.]|uniref:universal stress protein UspE n=1 Tax=Succinivibrio sp. TaxID=2053619 RepID=UPI0025DBF44D|nr:universal stress protein UspE [Succinivibrio sp.]MBQ9220962.1 universal stress protein UspE [Succinivibrio sp.]
MRKYTNILVIAEPKKDVQIALKRALDIAKFNPKATITYLRVVYDFSYDLLILNKVKEKPIHEDIEQTHIDHLNQIIEEYRAQENSEATIVPKVVENRDVGEAVIDEMRAGNYDLIIKAANRHGLLDSIIFTPIDWFILRHAEIPVIIAKNNDWQTGGNIAVCVDFTLNDHLQSNVAMLREAQVLAKTTGSRIHLINSAPVYMPTVMLEVPHYSPDLYEQGVLEEHKSRMYEFADKHHIDREYCHIEEGMPDDVIPSICEQINAKAVLIGSAGRSGLAAALIGNTCEEIVDDIDADLFVLNRKAIKLEKEKEKSRE